MNSPDILKLLDQAAVGDRDSANELLKRYYDTVLRIVREQLGPKLRRKMDSLDIVQTSLLEAYKSLPRYHFESEKGFLAWIRRIVLNKIRNRDRLYRTRMRDRSRERELEDPAGVPANRLSPSEELIAREDFEILDRALNNLPQDQRKVLLRRHYLNEGWTQIAAHFDRSSEAVQMLCQRAIKKLRKEFQLLRKEKATTRSDG